METKNLNFLKFLIKKSCNTNSMKKTSKGRNNLSKSHFWCCYFYRSLVKLENFIILFYNKWVIYGS